jgi:hypothetical protein
MFQSVVRSHGYRASFAHQAQHRSSRFGATPMRRATEETVTPGTRLGWLRIAIWTARPGLFMIFYKKNHAHRSFLPLALAFVALAVCVVPELASAQDIIIQGKTFYKDGRPWSAKGIKVEGFSRPAVIPVSDLSPAWMNKNPPSGRGWWGAAEIDAIRNKFHADTIRFAVSQPALDPQSPIYDPKYLTELLSVFKQARSAGFVVIPSMDAQAENGVLNLSCMPNDSTVRAWQTLAPALLHDKGVMFELFDEPCKTINAPGAKIEWARSMQTLIGIIRQAGSTNILLLDGLWWARSTNGLFPLVHDTIPDRLALAVHPYLVSENVFATEKQWHDQFGASAAQYPMIASEWNATPTNGCAGRDTPAIALSLLRYLEALHIGLVGWAIDSNAGKLVKDHTAYELTDYASFKDCKDGSDSGGGRLLANYPND